MANTALRFLQISDPEVTPGTAIPATEVVQGLLGSVPYGDLTIFVPEEDRTTLALNLNNDFIVGKSLEASLEGSISDRMAIWIFSNSIRGNVTPTQPEVATQPLSYVWLFEPGITTANTPDVANGIDTFTLEFGDNTQDYETSYVFTRTVTLTGAPNEDVKVSWEITGQEITEGARTGALSAAASQFFAANNTAFYIDANYAAIGTTQKTNTLMGWEWSFETQFTTRYAADKTLVFAAISENKKEVELNLTYYRGATAEAEKDKYEARTQTYLRIALCGNTELDVGQSNPPYIYLDGSFKYMEWPEPGDEDGSVTEEVVAKSVYDSTSGKQFGVTVDNLMSAYPA